jgi:hypothetical protein
MMGSRFRNVLRAIANEIFSLGKKITSSKALETLF